MTKIVEAERSPHRLWGEFRHSVVGGLLAAPPEKGQLRHEIELLATKKWNHPTKNKEVRIKYSTIEGWYYSLKNCQNDPLKTLRTKVRSDLGDARKISSDIGDILKNQYEKYPYWNYQLHFDNLKAAMKKKELTEKAPSYATVRRYMKAQGLRRLRKPRNADQPGAVESLITASQRETRSFEAEYVNATWHLDFHHGSLKVIDDRGVWRTPILLGIFDDASRLCCHIQWYYRETTENLVHGFCQALQKRGVPRELMRDNGAAMSAAEFTEGLKKLGILDRPIRPYTPNMNGKCEFVWSRVESRLLAMLEGYKDLTLKILNELTQAWVELEYNKHHHREMDMSPIQAFQRKKEVSRPSPDSKSLRMAFQMEMKRRQRRSDGTISLEGQRYEIPSRFRTLDDLYVKYARWDLSFVHIFDQRTGDPMDKIYPIDKVKNSSSLRRSIDNPVTIAPVMKTKTLPPLIEQLMSDYAALGIISAYIPKDDSHHITTEINSYEPS